MGLENYGGEDVVESRSIFDAKAFINCLTQEDIDEYNAKIAELNKFFNKIKKDKKKKDKVKYLKPLFKQLLFISSSEKEDFIEEFLDNNDFIAGLEEFKAHSKEKIWLIKSFLSTDDFKDNLDEILLNENQTHFFCNQFFGSWSYFRDLYYQKNKININGNGDKNEFKDAENMEKKEFSLLEIKELLDGKDDFKSDIQKGNFVLINNSKNEQSVYKDNLSNFDNFISFLRYYFCSLTNGRSVLTRLEDKDLVEFNRITEYLKKAKKDGEKIDELLLKKVSVENFRKNINESIENKENNFEIAFKKFKEFAGSKKRLDRESEFEFKRAINEYCNRISEINGFFTLFSVPEGIIGNVTSETIKKFKENNKIVPLYNEIRNFITKRGTELEKIKLNFDVKNLLGGWGYKTENHPDSSDYKCRLFKKGDKFYLGIIGKSSSGALNGKYLIMDYYQQKGQTIFGSVYRGMFNANYDDDRNNLDNNMFVQNIEKIVDKLLEDFPKAEKTLSSVKNMIQDKMFSFGVRGEEFGQLFVKKTGIKFSDYKNKKGMLQKEDIVVEILKEKFGDIFDYENDKNY
ncbi:MAG: hypothetical protein WA063_07145, partial [Minisyncoccia bacterium]